MWIIYNEFSISDDESEYRIVCSRVNFLELRNCLNEKILLILNINLKKRLYTAESFNNSERDGYHT